MTDRLPQLNLRYTMADMDRLQALLWRRFDAASIAEAMMIPADEVKAICRRNGWMVPR